MTAQTNTQMTRDLMQSARQGLLPARGGGWLAGFGNMLNKELGEWFGTRRWLVQALVWIAILDGMVALVLFVLPLLEPILPGLNASIEQSVPGVQPDAKGLYYYFAFAVMAGSIGVIILCQDEIIQETQTGTAAWILSKPSARQSFILTKLLSNMINALVFIIALPALVFMGEVYLDTQQVVSLLPFLAGLVVFILTLFFYISLVIMLGVLFETRGPILGVSFGLLLVGFAIGGFIPHISYILPVTMDRVAQLVVFEIPLPAMFVSEISSAAVLSIVFILVALWRFQRKEF
jgi:ABC-2 type transport system permease protein